jgi:hypothetical protein
MNTNFCIHIQTHPDHFEYTYNLLSSFDKLCKNIKNINIFLIFDNKNIKQNFKKNFNITIFDNLKINYLNLEKILQNNKFDFIIYETYQNMVINSLNKGNDIRWGGLKIHRKYVALKRTYSILELNRLGFEYIWCLDTESLVLYEFDINHIIEHNTVKPLLLINNINKGTQYPQIINKVFKWSVKSKHPINTICVRMNDFWVINSNYYKNMIQELSDVHGTCLSYFMNGCEQSLYEYYLFKQHSDNKIDIDLVLIDGDMHNYDIFRNIINKKNKNINLFCNSINEKYFNKTLSYRGDYINKLKKSDRGLQILDQLNLKIALSNYQGL